MQTFELPEATSYDIWMIPRKIDESYKDLSRVPDTPRGNNASGIFIGGWWYFFVTQMA